MGKPLDFAIGVGLGAAALAIFSYRVYRALNKGITVLQVNDAFLNRLLEANQIPNEIRPYPNRLTKYGIG
jgi:hypothetical protein